MGDGEGDGDGDGAGDGDGEGEGDGDGDGLSSVTAVLMNVKFKLSPSAAYRTLATYRPGAAGQFSTSSSVKFEVTQFVVLLGARCLCASVKVGSIPLPGSSSVTR